MPDSSQPPRKVIRLGDLRQRGETPFEHVPDAQTRGDLIADLGLLGLRKLRLTGRLIPEGRQDWRLEATLGATVVQPCVATLEPVTTRIDAPVRRRYLADHVETPLAEAGSEVEMPEDDTLEPLPAALDLDAVLAEALTLALPDWPRAEGAPPADVQTAGPGVTPLTDEAVRPFASLAGLRDKLASTDPAASGAPAGTGTEPGGADPSDSDMSAIPKATDPDRD